MNARIDYLKVQNFRALQEIELHELTPLTVFLGQAQSGKSIIYDAFDFLSESFKMGLRHAWDKRGGFSKLNPHGGGAPLVLELRFREGDEAPATTYHLTLREQDNSPYVEEEWIQWRGTRYGGSFRFVDLKRGKAMSRARLDVNDDRPFELITPPDTLSLSSLSQFPRHPRVMAVRQFIDSWNFSHLTAGGAVDAKMEPVFIQPGLPPNAETLADLLRTLTKLPPWILEKVLRRLQQKMQSFEKVSDVHLQELKQLLLQKDANNEAATTTILSKLGSDVTLKMFSYLATLYHPDPLQPITVELPENQQMSKLISELAAECRIAAEHSQLLVSTHAPEFANTLKAKELWIISKNEAGITRAIKAADMPGIEAYLHDGVLLGELWTRGFFDNAPVSVTNDIQA